MAGFSGGYKAIMPGIADIDAILRYHNAARIGHPRSAWDGWSLTHAGIDPPQRIVLPVISASTSC